MNYVQKLCLSIATVISFSNFGMMQQVIRDDAGFKVFDGKQVRPVQSCFVDPLLKRMNPEQMKKFIEQGNRIRAIRLSDGEHRLQAMVPGIGGGLGLATLAAGAVWISGTVTTVVATTVLVLTPAPGARIAAGATFAAGMALTNKAALVTAAAITFTPTP